MKTRITTSAAQGTRQITNRETFLLDIRDACLCLSMAAYSFVAKVFIGLFIILGLLFAGSVVVYLPGAVMNSILVEKTAPIVLSLVFYISLFCILLLYKLGAVLTED